LQALESVGGFGARRRCVVRHWWWRAFHPSTGCADQVHQRLQLVLRRAAGERAAMNTRMLGSTPASHQDRRIGWGVTRDRGWVRAQGGRGNECCADEVRWMTEQPEAKDTASNAAMPAALAGRDIAANYMRDSGKPPPCRPTSRWCSFSTYLDLYEDKHRKVEGEEQGTQKHTAAAVETCWCWGTGTD
jgi:hypothetical protein